MCSELVFAVEELKALGKVFHTHHFKCSGKAGDGCNRKLTLSDYVEHDGEPYCKFCHPKLFGTGAHRAGMINSTPLDKNIVNNRAKAEEEEAEESPKPNMFKEKDRIRRASLGKEAPIPPPAAAATAAPAAAAPAATASRFGGGTPTCCFCTKTVYTVDTLKALNRVWHKRCFKCSGTNGDGCMKVLNLTEYVDGKGKDGAANQPYCKNCYAKLMGPSGHNGALGMTSISHNNDTVTQRRTSVVVTNEEPSNAKLASAISGLKVTATNEKPAENKPQLLDAIEGTVFTASAQGVGPGSSSSERRPSLSKVKVGGNLKHDVNKERGFEGDGDEVDDDEWN
jgi:cysteine and glycine-rich protein